MRLNSFRKLSFSYYTKYASKAPVGRSIVSNSQPKLCPSECRRLVCSAPISAEVDLQLADNRSQAHLRNPRTGNPSNAQTKEVEPV
jgi:hypothetical protein